MNTSVKDRRGSVAVLAHGVTCVALAAWCAHCQGQHLSCTIAVFTILLLVQVVNDN